MVDSQYKVEPYKTTSMLCIRNVNGGRVPAPLSGTFTKEGLALEAIRRYEASKPAKVDYTPVSTPLIELDKLSKKDSLLEFADIVNIEVPASMKNPASIKKFIKEKLESE